ncbi:MAG: FtsK/SpoIIIE domain-containing protein [Acidimicrobiales bacterium]
MRLRFSATGGSARPDLDLLVEADEGVPVRRLVEAFAPHLGSGPNLFVGATRIDPDTPLSTSGLRDGAIVSVGEPGPVPPTAAAGGVELRVVGGPAAGTVTWLSSGRHVVGRGADADVQLADPELSRTHLAIGVAKGGLTIEDEGSRAGTFVEGVGVPQRKKPIELLPGALIAAGGTRLVVVPTPPADAVLSPSGDGGLVFNRRFRIVATPPAAVIELPPEPTTPDKVPFPLVAVVAPLLIGAVMAKLIGPEALVFAVLSPVMYLANNVTDRRRARRHRRKSDLAFRQHSSQAIAGLRAAVAAEREWARDSQPDLAVVVCTVTEPRGRLWERRPDDHDALLVRVGSEDRPTTVQLRGRDRTEVPTLHSMPVSIPLRDLGVIGVAGPTELARGVARACVVQLAALHSADDLRLAVLTESDARRDWEWIRWLPHARRSDATGEAVAIGSDPLGVEARVRELSQLVAARERDTAVPGRAPTLHLPYVVVVLDGASKMRNVPGLPQLLTRGPQVGVHAICLDQSEALLPEECRGVVAFDADVDAARVVVRLPGVDPRRDVLPDRLSPLIAEQVARAMAPIHRIGGEDAQATLPTALRLLEELGLEALEPSGLAARWRLAPRSTSAVLGRGIDGVFAIDLVKDGPHALVGGTTGAGKSELLQSMVASFAVANRPDELTFVLVDYKGGSAFRDCANLPHTVGVVTDLDGHLTERALTSLRAELKRREHVLETLAAKDIDDYWDKASREVEPVASLPRLVIVVDEFAALARDLPEFVTGLVSVAALGRSLGVHLVLATQRPSDCITPEIRANTNLRIALRVTDTAESTDVIDAADAALIPPDLAGRAFVRTAHDTLTQVQVARVGGRRPGTVARAADVDVATRSWPTLGHGTRLEPIADEVDGEDTDLHALVQAIADASDAEGIARQPSPWLPPLPLVLSLDRLPRAALELPGVPGPVPIGLEDVPEQQTQEPLLFDLRAGSLLLIGSARSGRSAALRSIAAASASVAGPSELHVHGLDCGNGALSGLTALPHCGVVALRSEPERAARLLERLADEARRRQQLMSQAGFADLTEQREASASSDRLPWILLLVDRYEGFVETFREMNGGEVEDRLMGLVRDGPAVGIVPVVAGDRSALQSRVASAFDTKLILRLNERDDYSLADLVARRMPTDLPPGRCFRPVSGREAQIALLGGDDSGRAQAAALEQMGAALGAMAAEAPMGERPLTLDALPSEIDLSRCVAMALDHPSGPGDRRVVLGVGGDVLAAAVVDLRDHGPAFIVAGPPRSGRSTALLAVARGLVAQGTKVVAVCPRRSRLMELDHPDSLVQIITGQQALEGQLDDAFDPDAVVIVDDAELVRADSPLLGRLAGLGSASGSIVIAGATEELRTAFGFVSEARKSRAGLLLCPQRPFDGQVLGLARPPTIAGPPGRGLLVLNGDTLLVQVAQS